MGKVCCTCGKKINMKMLLKKQAHKINGKIYTCDDCYKIVGYGRKFKSQEEFSKAYTEAIEVEKNKILGSEKLSAIKKVKKIISWLLVAFLLFLTIGTSGISSVLLIMAAVMAAPIEKLKELKRKIKISPVVTVVVSIILVFTAIMLSPTSDTEIPEIASVSESTMDSLEDNAEDTIQEVVEEEPIIEEVAQEEPEIVIPDDSTFSIRFIDVGQADAAIVECDGHYMMIDGGNKSDSSKMYTILKESGINYLDIMVGTHPDADHIGGLPGALNYATADVVLSPVLEHDTEAFEDFAKYAELNGGGLLVPEIGDKYYLGSSVVTILGLNSGNESNEKSIVLKISYGDTSFLFTGDGEFETEQELLNSGENLSATLLKVGHHGSADSSTAEFLEAVLPSYAIISVGDNNYDHPTTGALDRLDAVGAEIYRTDLQGNITVTSDSKTIAISCDSEATKEEILTSAEEAAAIAQAKAEAKAKAEAEAKAAEEKARAEAEANEQEKSQSNSNQVVETPSTGSGSYAVNMKNGKIHIVGQCPATGTGKNAMTSPKYFATYEEAYAYAITRAKDASKVQCGNCW